MGRNSTKSATRPVATANSFLSNLFERNNGLYSQEEIDPNPNQPYFFNRTEKYKELQKMATDSKNTDRQRAGFRQAFLNEFARTNTKPIITPETVKQISTNNLMEIMNQLGYSSNRAMQKLLLNDEEKNIIDNERYYRELKDFANKNINVSKLNPTYYQQLIREIEKSPRYSLKEKNAQLKKDAIWATTTDFGKKLATMPTEKKFEHILYQIDRPYANPYSYIRSSLLSNTKPELNVPKILNPQEQKKFESYFYNNISKFPSTSLQNHYDVYKKYMTPAFQEKLKTVNKYNEQSGGLMEYLFDKFPYTNKERIYITRDAVEKKYPALAKYDSSLGSYGFPESNVKQIPKLVNRAYAELKRKGSVGQFAYQYIKTVKDEYE